MKNYIWLSEASLIVKNAISVQPILIKNKTYWWQFNWWLYNAISLFTKSKYHHAALLVFTKKGCFVIQAIGKGVVLQSYSDWQAADPLRKTENLKAFSTASNKQIINNLLISLGASYQFSIFPLWFLSFLTGNKSKFYINPPFYCFELISFILGGTGDFWDANRLRREYGDFDNSTKTSF